MRKNKIAIDKFAKAVVEKDGDQKEAMRVISPELPDTSLSVKACRWMKDPKVIQSILSFVRKLDLTTDACKDLIKARLMKIILSSDAKDSDAIGASQTVAKIEKLMSDNAQQVNINVFDEVIRDIHAQNENIENIGNSDEVVPCVGVYHTDTTTIDPTHKKPQKVDNSGNSATQKPYSKMPTPHRREENNDKITLNRHPVEHICSGSEDISNMV